MADEDLALLLMETIPPFMRDLRERMASPGAALSIPQFRCLAFVAHHEGTSLTALGAALGLEPPAASKLVQALVEGGLMEREEEPANRRQRRLRLLPQGHARYQSARSDVQAALTRRLAILSAHEREDLAGGLEALRRLLPSKRGGGASEVPK
ncbi:MAG: MarR family winged helix-turn-helix transcriptional regulator [Thermoplasmatota archaeon]